MAYSIKYYENQISKLLKEVVDLKGQSREIEKIYGAKIAQRKGFLARKERQFEDFKKAHLKSFSLKDWMDEYDEFVDDLETCRDSVEYYENEMTRQLTALHRKIVDKNAFLHNLKKDFLEIKRTMSRNDVCVELGKRWGVAPEDISVHLIIDCRWEDAIGKDAGTEGVARLQLLNLLKQGFYLVAFYNKKNSQCLKSEIIELKGDFNELSELVEKSNISATGNVFEDVNLLVLSDDCNPQFVCPLGDLANLSTDGRLLAKDEDASILLAAVRSREARVLRFVQRERQKRIREADREFEERNGTEMAEKQEGIGEAEEGIKA